METYPIHGGGAVHRFDTGTFNWYVIEQSVRLTLFDAGFPGHYGIFQKGIRKLGRSVSDVTAIILTHAHAWRPYMAGILTHATLNGVFGMPGISKPRIVQHDQTLDVPGKPHVIHVPGHTPGEIALFIPGARVLIAGDALVTRNLITGELGNPEVVVPILSQDFEQSLRAALKDCEISGARPENGCDRRSINRCANRF